MTLYRRTFSRLISAAGTLLVTATMAQAAGTAVSAPSFSKAAHGYVGRIDSQPPTGDIDRDFAAFLVPQHLSGVDLSKVAITDCKNTMLRGIAKNILAHADRNEPVTTDVPQLPQGDPRRAKEIRLLTQANHRASADFSAPASGGADRQFARLMGAHHQRAMDYASAEISLGRDPHLLTLARSILAGQRGEHEQMMALLSHQG